MKELLSISNDICDSTQLLHITKKVINRYPSGNTT